MKPNTSSPGSTQTSHDSRVVQTRNINNTVDSISSAARRSRAQTAAYLLGAHQQLPDIDDEETNRVRAVQLFYSSEALVPEGLRQVEDHHDPVLSQYQGLSERPVDSEKGNFIISNGNTARHYLHRTSRVSYSFEHHRSEHIYDICGPFLFRIRPHHGYIGFYKGRDERSKDVSALGLAVVYSPPHGPPTSAFNFSRS
jgi:hypothetical protein